MSDAAGDSLVALDNAAAELGAALSRGIAPSNTTLRVALDAVHAHAQWVRAVRASMPPLVVR